MHRIAVAAALAALLVLVPVSGAGAAYDPDRVIVAFKPGVTSAQQAAVLGGRAVVGGIDGTRVKLVQARGEPAAVAARLARSPLVEYAEVNAAYEAQVVPNDPLFAQQWGLDAIDAPEAWDAPALVSFPATGGAKIGIVDTGILQTHEDLAGKTVNCARAVGFFGIISTIREGTCLDDNGHGSYVAAIAAALTNNTAGVAGVSFSSPLAVCKALSASGSGYALDVANCILYLTNKGAKVISMSLGGPGTTTLRNQVANAASKDVVLVAAAGNDGNGTIRYPAGYPEVISVAATDSTDTRASFSNMNADVELAAPGVGIVSAWKDGGYRSASGTSAATPHVSGAAAVLRTLQPALTAQQVRGRLTSTAVDLGDPGRDTSYGFGRIDLDAAAAAP